MKKILSTLLAVLIIFSCLSFVACGKTEEEKYIAKIAGTYTEMEVAKNGWKNGGIGWETVTINKDGTVEATDTDGKTYNFVLGGFEETVYNEKIYGCTWKDCGKEIKEVLVDIDMKYFQIIKIKANNV